MKINYLLCDVMITWIISQMALLPCGLVTVMKRSSNDMGCPPRVFQFIISPKFYLLVINSALFVYCYMHFVLELLFRIIQYYSTLNILFLLCSTTYIVFMSFFTCGGTGVIWFLRQIFWLIPVQYFGAKNTWLLLTLSDYSLFQYLHLWFILTIFSTLEYVYV